MPRRGPRAAAIRPTSPARLHWLCRWPTLRCNALQVEIMMALEDKFDITLDEEGAEKISTVQEAADLIAAQMATK